jgi:hypothetical protein
MTIKTKSFAIALSATDAIKVKLHISKGEVAKFAINLEAFAGGDIAVVYRVDLAHGRLHEHRNWRIDADRIVERPDLIGASMGDIVVSVLDEVKANYERWRELYMKRRREK